MREYRVDIDEDPNRPGLCLRARHNPHTDEIVFELSCDGQGFMFDFANAVVLRDQIQYAVTSLMRATMCEEEIHDAVNYVRRDSRRGEWGIE